MNINKVFKRVVLLIFIVSTGGAVYAGNAYSIGKNIITNGGFEQDKDKNGVPDGWIRSVQMPGAKAVVALEKYKGGNCVKSCFLNPRFMLQARVFQNIKVTPGKVYELSYKYKTGVQKGLKADVMLTGTGPIYRCIGQEPSPKWIKKKLLFWVPTWMKGDAAIYVQNRSMVPIWYDDISFKETDIDKKDIKKYQPSVTVQAVTSEDQLIMPGSNKKTADFIVNVKSAGKNDSRYQFVPRLIAGNKGPVDCKVLKDRVSIPLSLLEDGTSVLSVLLFDKSDQSLVASARLNIEKIPISLMKGNLDLRKAAVVMDANGKPFFPIGMYGLNVKCSRKDLRELKSNGFNTVHSYSFEGGSGIKKPELIKAFLDMVDKSDMKVIGGLPRSIVEKSGRVKQLTNWINLLKVHPSLLFYYSDEMISMRNTPLSLIKTAYNTIKKLDPKREWISYDSPLQRLAPYMDGIMIGVTNVNTAKLIRLRIGEDKPVIAVFGQSYYKAGKAPSIKEARYNVFMPVVLGARGVFFWWYPTIQWHNKEKELLAERLYDNTRILAEVGPAMVSEKKFPGWIREIKTSGGARYCVGVMNDVVYLLAGAEKSGKRGTVEVSIPSGYNVDPMLKCDLKSNGQKYTLNLNPEDTAVLKIMK